MKAASLLNKNYFTKNKKLNEANNHQDWNAERKQQKGEEPIEEISDF